MSKKSFYHISKLLMPFAQPGFVFILNNTNKNPVSFIEEHFDSTDTERAKTARCIIKLNVSLYNAFNKKISYETGQVLWTPKSEFMRCQIISIDTFENLPLYTCSWRISKFICDLGYL